MESRYTDEYIEIFLKDKIVKNTTRCLGRIYTTHPEMIEFLKNYHKFSREDFAKMGVTGKFQKK